MTANALVSFALGLLGPFWIIYAQNLVGSIEFLGFAVGIRVFSYSLTTYFVGALSDKFGRVAFIVAGGIISGVIMLLYTMVTSLTELYILQTIFGIAGAMQVTASTALLGDITEKNSRGKDVGKMNAATGIAGALAIIVGGIVAGKLGIEAIFYVIAGFFFISSALILFMKVVQPREDNTQQFDNLAQSN
ncbi:MAG: MFS transporter [Candidatus Spechtbacteria bacterium]|nr:MFS transporter [Candidatus Spechtbacteria bacterium]